MLQPAEKILAIDFGTKRIGLAVSFASLADPLTVIPADEQALSYICNVINNYRISRVIVGISENEMARKTQEFVIQLKRVLKVPIELHDETLSTHSVRSKLADQHKTQRRPVDHLAAAEFLQDWLDTRPTHVPGL